jgi:CheY-like chemotaxis protein
MPTILIADACKPSLVMSSEVFKDKIAGATILVAANGRQCLEVLANSKPDMCVVDFDLPDVDGVTLIAAMRKTYSGPILLTAYPDKIVEQAVNTELFAYNDSGAWIPKPVKFDALSEKIDRFLLDKLRLGKRFDLEIQTLLIGKGAGRGKRAPKVSGKILNISLGGACIEVDEPAKMKGGEEMTVTFTIPADPTALRTVKVAPAPKKAEGKLAAAAKGKAGAKPTLTTKAAKPEKVAGIESKLKGTVAWIDKKSGKVGLQFAKLTDVQKKSLEGLLRATV